MYLYKVYVSVCMTRVCVYVFLLWRLAEGRSPYTLIFHAATWRELTRELRFWVFLKLKVQRVYTDRKSQDSWHFLQMRRAEGFPEVFLGHTRDWEQERGKEEVGLLGFWTRFLVYLLTCTGFILPWSVSVLTLSCGSFLVHTSALPKLCLKTSQYHSECFCLSASSAACLVLLALAIVPSWPILAFFTSHDSALTNATIPGIWPQPDLMTDSAMPFGFPGRGTCRLSGEPDDTLGPDCDSQVCSGPSAAWGALLWVFS